VRRLALVFGCQAGSKCTRGSEPANPAAAYIGCAATGSAAIGEPCTYAVSATEDCGSFYADTCVEGTCEAICGNLGGDPMCDDQHTCVTHPGLFQYGSDNPYAAGACE
jgi:hypothetical protein